MPQDVSPPPTTPGAAPAAPDDGAVPRGGAAAGRQDQQGPAARAEAELVLPLAEETATVSKRKVVTGQVRVALSTEVERVALRETLRGRRVEVERVPMNRVLPEGAAPPGTREEGEDTLVISVVEETAVVVKRLVLREEVRLRFLPTEAAFEEEVPLRRQTATVERVAPSPPSADPTPRTEGNTPP